MNIKKMEEIIDDAEHPERKYLILPEYLEEREIAQLEHERGKRLSEQLALLEHQDALRKKEEVR